MANTTCAMLNTTFLAQSPVSLVGGNDDVNQDEELRLSWQSYKRELFIGNLFLVFAVCLFLFQIGFAIGLIVWGINTSNQAEQEKFMHGTGNPILMGLAIAGWALLAVHYVFRCKASRVLQAAERRLKQQSRDSFRELTSSQAHDDAL